MMMKMGMAKKLQGGDSKFHKKKKKWFVLSPFSPFLALWNGIMTIGAFYFLLVETFM